MSAGQLWRFYNEINIGDTVVTYDPNSRAYYLGTVKSNYKYSDKHEYHHFRDVEWEEGPHYRDELSTSSKNTLGAIMTIFLIPNEVKEELERAHPGYVSIEDLKDSQRLYEEYQKEEEDRLREDIISRSNEFIKDLIAELSSDDVEKLVAGILAAMGYKCRLTPQGRDLGSDILASPDGLGMLEPRIKVEVKHKIISKSKVSAPDIRNFLGGLRGIEKGIYVSTTGFAQEAKYEAERANYPITLIDFDFLVDLLTEYYERLESNLKALVPLKRIYWPL